MDYNKNVPFATESLSGETADANTVPVAALGDPGISTKDVRIGLLLHFAAALLAELLSVVVQHLLRC